MYSWKVKISLRISSNYSRQVEIDRVCGIGQPQHQWGYAEYLSCLCKLDLK